jgi:hypothetical protein
MIKNIVILALAAAVTTPAVARTTAEPVEFVRDGVAYRYSEEKHANGHKVLRGTAGGKPFRLVVTESRVRGWYDMNPVTFRLSEMPRQGKEAQAGL